MVGKCRRCGNLVGAAEERLALGRSWHIECFTCAICNRGLDSMSLAEHRELNEIYCKSCYRLYIGPEGYGYGPNGPSLIAYDMESQEAPPGSEGKWKRPPTRLGKTFLRPKTMPELRTPKSNKNNVQKSFSTNTNRSRAVSGRDSPRPPPPPPEMPKKSSRSKSNSSSGSSAKSRSQHNGSKGKMIPPPPPPPPGKNSKENASSSVPLLPPPIPPPMPSSSPKNTSRTKQNSSIRVPSVPSYPPPPIPSASNSKLRPPPPPPPFPSSKSKSGQLSLKKSKSSPSSSKKSSKTKMTKSSKELTPSTDPECPPLFYCGGKCVGTPSTPRYPPGSPTTKRIPLGPNYGAVRGVPKGIGEPCRRCGRPVFLAELQLGYHGAYHTECFKCCGCGKKLDSTTVSEHQGEIFCTGCYRRNFGTSGVGFGLGAGALQTP